jgi:hypothetical protein
MWIVRGVDNTSYRDATAKQLVVYPPEAGLQAKSSQMV